MNRGFVLLILFPVFFFFFFCFFCFLFILLLFPLHIFHLLNKMCVRILCTIDECVKLFFFLFIHNTEWWRTRTRYRKIMYIVCVLYIIIALYIANSFCMKEMARRDFNFSALRCFFSLFFFSMQQQRQPH